MERHQNVVGDDPALVQPDLSASLRSLAHSVPRSVSQSFRGGYWTPPIVPRQSLNTISCVFSKGVRKQIGEVVR